MKKYLKENFGLVIALLMLIIIGYLFKSIISQFVFETVFVYICLIVIVGTFCSSVARLLKNCYYDNIFTYEQ